MVEKQKTLESEACLSGIGLHSGLNIKMTIKPAQENQGFLLKRIDLEGCPTIKPIATNVVQTERGTMLEENGAKVNTIEHVIAALRGCDIDNATIELNAPEAPILDGTSMLIVKAIEEAGIIEQEAERQYFIVREKITHCIPEIGAEITILPDDEECYEVMVSYNSKLLKNQFAYLTSMKNFKDEIADSRTFVFTKEIELLLEHGLIKGGSLNNAIVFAETNLPEEKIDKLCRIFNVSPDLAKKEGILNGQLKHSNEPARHKLLDLIGDLSLTGRRFKGRVIARRPGHMMNVEFAKKFIKIIKQQEESYPFIDFTKKPFYEINQIKTKLAHRYPILLVDKIMDIKDGDYVVGIKNVTTNEPFFMGHFPNEPIMPGVLIIEALGQAGGILVLNGVEDADKYSTYFVKVEEFKFKHKVIPGDTLVLYLKMDGPIRRSLVKMIAKAFVGNKLVAEGILVAQVIKNKI